MKKILIITLLISLIHNYSFGQVFSYDKQNDLYVSEWTKDPIMQRFFWDTKQKEGERNKFVVWCIGISMTRVILIQNNVEDSTIIINHPELCNPDSPGYLILKFRKDIKKVVAFFPDRGELGFTLEVTLKDSIVIETSKK